jgi:hypothetical protein
LEPDDVCLILLSLRTNENLQTLGLENCLGVRGTEVFRVMLELTQANPWLKSIELSGTHLREEQKEAVRAQLVANAKQGSETNVETVSNKPKSLSNVFNNAIACLGCTSSQKGTCFSLRLRIGFIMNVGFYLIVIEHLQIFKHRN